MGEGRGEYPTIPSFEYRETLVFTRRDGRSLAYEQRTRKRFDGQTDDLVSHWENGFIRVLDNDVLELVNAQSGGRCEIMTGTPYRSGSSIRIRFESQALINDPRLVAASRTFELEGDTLRYEMEMQTTRVSQPTLHLRIALHRCG